jgi:ribonuclease Z
MTQLSIIFLGTGGSWPTLKRNVTSIAVKRGREIILFDCGEGTQRQFQKSKLSYMQISKIFITHFHGDHFLGLPGLVQTMQLNDRDKPLHIYGPPGIVTLCSQLFTLGYFKPNYKIIAHEITPGDSLEFDTYFIHTIKVNHNVPTIAYCLEEKMRPGKFNKSKALSLGIPEGPLFGKLQRGFNITLDNGTIISPNHVLGPPRKGRKIVYSGDTKPSTTLIKFAHEADVLIHDSTFHSDLEDIARDYSHSTATQSAQIAKDAHVQRLYLFHISPRYLETKELEIEARKIFPHSFVAKDFQEVEIKLKK